jgi:CRP/FNR family transcriptional regulator
MDPDRDIELGEAEFFRVLDPQALARVGPLVRERRFERHRVLFFEGQPAESLWILRRGEVRLYKSSSEGRITTLEGLGPGEIFGAISALDQPAYPASAEAMTEGVAWCVPKARVLRLIDEQPRLALEILQIVSRRLRDAHERLRSFAHDPAPSRLARALLRATQQGEARVTRRVLADASGTTVETAIRVLRRFEKEGIIRGGVGRIEVLDEPALQRIAVGAAPP